MSISSAPLSTAISHSRTFTSRKLWEAGKQPATAVTCTAGLARSPATVPAKLGNTQIDAGSGYEYWLLKFDGISGNGDHGTKLAWLLTITFLPVIGILLYLMFGINYRHHIFFRRRHDEAIRVFTEENDDAIVRLLKGDMPFESVDERFRPLARLLSNAEAGNNLSAGNSFEIITSGLRKQELLLKDIAEARESIHLEYFHFGNDRGGREVMEALGKKASEGVEVRFLNENIADFPIPTSY